MLATKNIVIELVSIIICGTAIGMLMALTANGFVHVVLLATEYRTSLSLFNFSFRGSAYSLSSIASLLAVPHTDAGAELGPLSEP